MGRVWKTTNPYRTGDTKQWTEKQYDDLGRLKKSTTPDGGELVTSFGLATSGSQIGTTILVTDQAGKVRRSITDASSQLIRVDEPNDSGDLGVINSPNQSTVYTYDVSDNLTQIIQGGQTRTFTYDAMDRLKSANNPESGTVTYKYDENSNMTEKKDARNVTTTFTYDTLNRPKSKSYSDSTPTISYFYDNSGVSNSKGKLTKISNSNSSSEYTSFDSNGRVLSSKQSTDGQNYVMSYSYDLGSNLIETTYPSGRKIKNTIATDGDLSKVETQLSGGSYVTRADNFNYAASGSVSSMKLGNNRWESTILNSTLQPTQIALGTSQNATDLHKIEYSYGTTDNNGNVKSQTITVPSGFVATQNYTYDSLNRLKTATETVSSSQSWKQTLLYDRFGNRTFDLANSTIPNQSGANSAVINPSIDSANNRFTTSQGYVYDLSGNLTQDLEGRKYLFDGENKQTEVQDSTTNQVKATYSYDGDGNRVKKTVAATSEQTIFVYDADGDLVAEYLQTELTPQTPTTQYLTNDALGSPRIITDGNGDVFSRRDFAPFGEDLLSGVGSRSSSLKYDGDTIRQKFTGKQRDNETNLDYFEARYYSSRWGRFTNPDEFTGGPEELIEFDGMMGHNPTFYAELAEPQSLNKYQYALNNPLRYIDPDGHQSRTADRTYDRLTYPIISKKDADAIGREIEDFFSKAWEGTKILVKEGNKYGAFNCPMGGYCAPNLNMSTMKAEASGEVKIEGQTSSKASSSSSPNGGKNKPSKQSNENRTTSNSQTKKGIRSIQKQISSHEKKLADYKKDPDKFDNKGVLKKASRENRQKIINGRVRKLENEIKKFKNEIKKLEGKN
jgi:RHS repeat-associated protein